MALETLTLDQLYGFEHLELSFEADLTVLVGPNGSGKTSVLAAIRSSKLGIDPAARRAGVGVGLARLVEAGREHVVDAMHQVRMVQAADHYATWAGPSFDSRPILQDALSTLPDDDRWWILRRLGRPDRGSAP